MATLTWCSSMAPRPASSSGLRRRAGQPFTPFTSLPELDWQNPNLKFVDVTGDGHADLLISEDDAFWWHPSLAAAGFGPAQRVQQALDEEKGPKLIFADGTESIFLADVSGDGLTDLVRIRNGEVCYWPNLGYGRFGAKVTMDHSPWFETSRSLRWPPHPSRRYRWLRHHRHPLFRRVTAYTYTSTSPATPGAIGAF